MYSLLAYNMSANSQVLLLSQPSLEMNFQCAGNTVTRRHDMSNVRCPQVLSKNKDLVHILQTTITTTKNKNNCYFFLYSEKRQVSKAQFGIHNSKTWHGLHLSSLLQLPAGL